MRTACAPVQRGALPSATTQGHAMQGGHNRLRADLRSASAVSALPDGRLLELADVGMNRRVGRRLLKIHNALLQVGTVRIKCRIAEPQE